MKIILLSSNEHRGARSLEIGRRGACLIGLVAVLLPLLLVAGGFSLADQRKGAIVPQTVISAWQDRLQLQRDEVERTRAETETALEALTMRVAQLQAGLIRIDALGQRVSRAAQLDGNEFNFGVPSAVGGPEGNELVPYAAPALSDVLDQLAVQLEDREQQLDIMGSLLVNRQLRSEIEVGGRPVLEGWVTSLFGHRTDPFKGHRAWHNGVDFAGQLGSAVVAVASGVVTWAGDRSGYGLMLEINHGGGYVTRYGHNQRNLVAVGDVVKKGQVIANMGSSGRSTGPHVHFEVFRHGKSVDPSSYIDRTKRS